MSRRGRGRGASGRGAGSRVENGAKTDDTWARRSRGPAGDPCTRVSSNVGAASASEGEPNARESELQSGKFEDACVRIQESVKRYIQKHGMDFAADSDEDDDEETSALDRSAILDSLFRQFDPKGQEGKEADLEKTKQFLDDCLRGGDKIVCLICIESIRKTEEIWSCSSCYSGFHLSCIQKWAKDSVYMIGEALENVDKSQIRWCCPKCRKEYEQRETPRYYFCWCGKQRDPANDPWLVPHSCGQPCKRALGSACGHTCNLLCHPGPCPPCPVVVKARCHCGKGDDVPRRCSRKLWSCQSACGRKLECGFHTCGSVCHAGDCPPCPEKSLQHCVCGRSKAVLRPCSDREWHCESACGSSLSCGHHKCEKICHPKGGCGDCPLTGPRSCPCGKVKMRLPCTENIGPCGDTCGKQLTCGVHVCAARCHRSDCGGCLQLSLKRCRCGAKEKEVPCQKEYLCDIKCKRTRDCKRHGCNRKCCTGDCPPCEQPCGRSLGCRNHKCTSRCHAGPCYPCNLTVEIKCFCGKTSRKVPCGRERGARPPRCSESCRVPSDCHHGKGQSHKCHFGPCPPCTLRCGLALKTCSHPCESTCHDAVLRRKLPGKKADTPWEVVTNPEMEVVRFSCPPCRVPVRVECLGKHEISDLPCGEANVYSCGKGCGRLLACKNHVCSLPCHFVMKSCGKANVQGDLLAGENCETCARPCGKPRPSGCKHPCSMELSGKGCHPGPCPMCEMSIKMGCHCGVNSIYVKCCRWTQACQVDKDGLLSCQNGCPKTMSCGHSCTFACHAGNCADPKTCKKKVQVRCSCKRKKKDVPCVVFREQAVSSALLVPCDEFCTKKLEEQEQELGKKRKEEEELKSKKAQEELEAFERKMKGAGRKRKPRAESTDEEGVPWWKSTYGKAVLLTGCCCLLAGVFLATWVS